MSKIEWTDKTWNPIRGCTRVSEGCRNCYAEKIAARFSGPGKPFEGFARGGPTGARWTGKVELIESKLEEPLRWRKPRMVFVNSMSDLWHEGLPFYAVLEVYKVMMQARWHIFQVLTKRPGRRADAITRWTDGEGGHMGLNIWEGTSIEDANVLGRLYDLRQTPAAVRFLSLEPLIGPLCPDLRDIHWVIIGGESGPGARLMEPKWVDDIIEAADDAGAAVFVKQLGTVLGRRLGDKGKGDNMATWPPRWRRREFPG